MNRMLSVSAFALSAVAAHAAPTVFSAAGADPASVQGTVDAFRSAISNGGVFNAPNTGPFANGRREINWDAPALDAFQSPALMPNDFFNNNNKRGATFSTPDGSGFLVSKRVADGGARFGDIDPAYNTSFQTFSAQRLFGVAGGVICDTVFSVPTTPGQSATVNGFGAIFTDVDLAGSTAIEFYAEGGDLLRRLLVPVSPDGGLSFLGVHFADGERVERVRIFSGNAALGAGVLDDASRDVVAMDDFFYGEPLPIPAPGVPVLLASGLLTAMRRTRK